MKSTAPHDPRDETLDELIALALHGELTPEERTQFDSRLQTDPAAQAAYQEAQAMHDLLEKTHKEAQPDPAFEQRMVSGVRRKIQSDKHRETAWESVLALWLAIRAALSFRYLWAYGGVCSLILVLAVGFLISNGNQVKGVFTTITSQLAIAGSAGGIPVEDFSKTITPQEKSLLDARASAARRTVTTDITALGGASAYAGGNSVTAGKLTVGGNALRSDAPATLTDSLAGTGGFTKAARVPIAINSDKSATLVDANEPSPDHAAFANPVAPADPQSLPQYKQDKRGEDQRQSQRDLEAESEKTVAVPSAPAPSGTGPGAIIDGAAQPVEAPAAPDNRKLIRNANLDLEVQSFQAAMDQITAFTKAAGGYVDTSNSQKGGNGKLQGTVVVKVLPQNLDAFLLKLRDAGQVQNQSVSTDDVTKDYFDTQARLTNSQRMETQLQELLKHESSKVADLLAVERELGRVRGEIEQMQGQLKLYDFQVQYATVTMNMSEKDLNQAAAYLLKEQDDFSLFATDVEATFQKARQSADDFKAEVLTANLNHNSGSDVSAELVVMVAPEQIDLFLAQVRGLGRVANFTRQTQRVAKDGGDSTQPADETRTDKDKVQVHLAIRSDDETRKQVALTVVTKAVESALDQAKAAALANPGVEILASSLNKTPQGQSTAQLNVRVPGKNYDALISAFNALGRTASLSIQRNDDSGPGSNGDDAPVIVSLALTDDDTPLQQTEMTVAAKDVDQQSQQIKKAAGDAGVEVKASSFERQPDGSEIAQMTFRLPMAKYPAFLETVKALGKVDSFTVRRDDRPDQLRADDTAPAEITLQLHNQRDIIADDDGLWATLRQTFGQGAGALFTSVRVIGVILAFLVPWVFAIGLFAWVGRRIYIRRKK